MRLSILWTGLTLGLCTATARAQDAIAPGFQPAGMQSLPAAFAAYDTLSTGERIVFDGSSIDLYASNGSLLLHLGDTPSFVFASFIEADPSETFALVGESSNGDLFKVALDGSGMSTLANAFFNYDAVFEDATHALVSAATCGWSCGNNIVRIDTQTGALTQVAHVPGASGPVGMALDGSLLYGVVSDVFPSPPGSSSILAWSAEQLRSGAVLGVGDATLFHGGLNGASSLAVDPVFGSVFLASSVFGSTSQVLEFTPEGDLVGPVVQSTEFLGYLELQADGGPGYFHAYQPPDGVKLLYFNGDVVTVRPARPRAVLSGSGAFQSLQITGAPPNGSMVVTFTGAQHGAPQESAHPFEGTLYVTPFDLAEVRRVALTLPVSAAGAASYSFAFTPGAQGRSLELQAVLLDADGRFAATSNPVD